jgi:hypothetical protein
VPPGRTGIRRQLGYLPQEVGFPRGFTAFAFVDYIALLKERAHPAPTAAGRTTLVALAAREMRRFAVNPVFLFAVVMTAWTGWTPQRVHAVTEIDSVNGNPAIFLGGFGMMATYWLTRSMRASEPPASASTSACRTPGASSPSNSAAPRCGSSTAAANFSPQCPGTAPAKSADSRPTAPGTPTDCQRNRRSPARGSTAPEGGGFAAVHLSGAPRRLPGWR